MNPRSRNTVIGIIVGVVLVLCCCLVVAVGVVVADPFGWHLLSLLNGQADPVALAVPADAPFYAATDLKTLTSPQMARLMKAFGDVPGGSNYSSPDSALKQLDQNLDQQLGLTFTGDIQPWLAGNVGLAITQLPQPDDPSSAAFVLIANARDTAKADAFIGKLMDGMVKNNGGASTETDFQGVTLHVWTPTEGQPMVAARSKDLVLLTNNPSAIQAAIQAQTGKVPALSSNADFKSLRTQMPGTSVISMFVNGQSLVSFVKSYQNSTGSLGTSLGPAQADLEALRSARLAISVVDQGVRLDAAVAYDAQKLSDAQRQMLTTHLDETASRLLPENTLAYIAGQGLDQIWANYRDSANPSDLKDQLSAFETQYGFNPDEALFPYLKGGWLLALVPDSDSVIAQQSGGPALGFIGLVQTNNATALNGTLQTFNGKMKDNGASIDSQTLAGVPAFVVSNQGQSTAVYGIGQDHFALASSTKVFTDIFDTNKTLADAAGYQQVWGAFPSTTQRVLYADVAGIVKVVRSGMSGASGQSFDETVAAYLQPIQSVATGTMPLNNGVAQTTTIVFIAGMQP